MKLTAKQRIPASIAVLGILFAALLVFAVQATINQTQSMETARTQTAAKSMLASRLHMVQQLAEDNANWNEAVKAVYAPVPDEAMFMDSWGALTKTSPSYEAVAILDAQGKTRFAYRDGQKTQMDIRAVYGRSVDMLVKQLDAGQQQVAGFASAGDQIVFIGIANIRPTDSSLAHLVPQRGQARLAFVKNFDAVVANEIATQLVIRDLRTDLKPVERPGIPLATANGQTLAWLSWQAPSSKASIIREMLPQIGMAILLFTAILLAVARHASHTVKLLSSLALTDGLSGLPNRRAVHQKLKTAPDQSPTALALIDLDGFKGVNDNYGHDVGDELIKQVAKDLLLCAGKNATVARLGGDEFAVLLLSNSAAQDIVAVAGAVLARVADPFLVGDRTIQVGASIGLASGTTGQIDHVELMRQADVAMYEAKNDGKMRACWFDPKLDMTRAAAHEVALALRGALYPEELQVAYQPIIDVQANRVIGVEALARWTSPVLGDVRPDVFIPVAEETGLIDRVGQHILHRACLDMRDSELNLAVNVSAAQLRNPLFLNMLASVIAETGFPVERLEIEITENYVLDQTDTARRILHGLRDLGVSIALDDFGSGYASIGFLRQFPFTKLKLDRTLVHEAATDSTARMLVQASVATARAMSMTVTAEGIENADHAALMHVAGCDALQGWHFGRPVSRDEIHHLIQQQAA